MPLYRPKNSDHWYISISHNGERIRETTGTSDRKAAQELHDRRKAELWREVKLGERLVRFGEACVAWLKAGERGRNDRYATKFLLSVIPADTDIGAMDDRLVE